LEQVIIKLASLQTNNIQEDRVFPKLKMHLNNRG
jgi:hypothetical protein